MNMTIKELFDKLQQKDAFTTFEGLDDDGNFYVQDPFLLFVDGFEVEYITPEEDGFTVQYVENDYISDSEYHSDDVINATFFRKEEL